MKKIRIKPELLNLLISGEFNRFSCNGLIKAYQELPATASLTQRQAKQFIQRNIDRLEWAGLIVKESEFSEYYVHTDKFHTDNYAVGTPHIKPVNKDTSTSDSPAAQVISEPLVDLQNTLTLHKLELLTTISETEEYERLSKDLPSKKVEIQRLYNNARNRYSTTLGKIRALESLLSSTNGPNT